MSEAKILVVEYHEQVANLYQAMLPNYTIVKAGSMGHAIEHLKNDPTIGLVFTAIKLQGEKDGYELCDYITKNHKNVRTVISSGVAEPGRATGVGAVDLLIKPFKRPELEDMVKKHYPAKEQ